MTGDVISGARLRCDLDQYELAKAIGVHPHTLMRWEAETRVTAESLHKTLLEAFVKWEKRATKYDREVFTSHLRIRLSDPLLALHFFISKTLGVS